MSGGPVEPTHGFVLFESDTPAGEEEISIQRGLALSGSTETLFRLVQHESAGNFMLFLGYSGWAPRQLEREIEENSWLVAPLDPSLLFEIPAGERWERALRSIGVDPGTLVDAGGASPS
jgi:putative transcriptional regulator